MSNARKTDDLFNRKALALQSTNAGIARPLWQSLKVMRLVRLKNRLRKLQRICVAHMSAVTEAIAIGLTRGAEGKKSLRVTEQPENAIRFTDTRISHILAKAAPSIQRSGPNPRPRGIVVNVSHAVEQLIIIEDWHTLKSILEYRPFLPVFELKYMAYAVVIECMQSLR